MSPESLVVELAGVFGGAVGGKSPMDARWGHLTGGTQVGGEAPWALFPHDAIARWGIHSDPSVKPEIAPWLQAE